MIFTLFFDRLLYLVSKMDFYICYPKIYNSIKPNGYLLQSLAKNEVDCFLVVVSKMDLHVNLGPSIVPVSKRKFTQPDKRESILSDGLNIEVVCTLSLYSTVLFEFTLSSIRVKLPNAKGVEK